MVELKHRPPALHPEPRYLEIVINFRRIDTKHEAYSDLFKMRG